jgi:hypothetical protein
MPVRIRLSILMSIHIRILILTHAVHKIEFFFFFTFIHSSANLHCFYLSRQRHSCKNVQYFGLYFKISGKSIIKLYIFGYGSAKTIPIRMNPDSHYCLKLGSLVLFKQKNVSTGTRITVMSNICTMVILLSVFIKKVKVQNF